MGKKQVTKAPMTQERRARINRLKKKLVVINFSVIAIAILGCLILSMTVCSMSGRINELERQLEVKAATINAQDIEEKDKNSQTEKIAEEKTTTKKAEKQEDSEKKTEKNDEKTEESTTEVETPKPEPDKVAYLTFDDGPSANTYKLLDMLDKYKVKATFFVNGNADENYKPMYQEIVKRGHSIGMHSYTHIFEQVYESLDSFKEDTERIHKFLLDTTGVDVKLYRFPGGSSTSRTTQIKKYIQYLDSQGIEYFDWNVSSQDATVQELPTQVIIDSVLNGLNNQDKIVILFHDFSLKNTTIESLKTIIPALKKQGYEILPITETSTPVHHNIN